MSQADENTNGAVHRVSILIADDCAVTRSMIKRAIVLAGVKLGTVHEASNGQEALSILQRHAVGVLFTDVNMPVMSGIDLLQEVATRGCWDHVIRVVVSADGSSMRKADTKRLGVSFYIDKPFRPETMRDVFSQLVTRPDRPRPSLELQSALQEVAEVGCCAYAEPCDRTTFAGLYASHAWADPPSGDWLQAAVSFRGSCCGRMRLTTRRGVVTELCRSFSGLGPEADLSPEEVDGFATELVNMICGLWLTRAYDDYAFDLSEPSLEPAADRDEPSLESPADALGLDVYACINETPAWIHVQFLACQPTRKVA